MNTKINEILQEIESVIVGKNEIVEKILMAILAQGHVLMEDVPGVGKTTTAMAFAKVLGLETRRVQFTSDTVPSDRICIYRAICSAFVVASPRKGRTFLQVTTVNSVRSSASAPQISPPGRYALRKSSQ